MNRKAYKEQMREDFPDIPEYIIDWALDILAKDNGVEFFRNMMKQNKKNAKKPVKVSPTIPESFEMKCVEIIKAKTEDENFVPPQQLKLSDNGMIV